MASSKIITTALLTAAATAPAWAQQPAPSAPPTPPAPVSSAASAAEPTTLAPVRVTGKAAPTAPVTGFGDAPLATTPIAATVASEEQLKDAGITRLSDAAKLDPSVSDAYNSEGYISYFTVRGYQLDNRYAIRRDGLPINGDTTLPLDNKSTVSVLKGTSGMQAGTSAPGGLLDLTVKRPLASAPLTSGWLGWSERGTWGGGVDISRHVDSTSGRDGIAWGWRLNVAAEHLDPKLRDMDGKRHVLALAADTRFNATGTFVEAEVEQSRREQRSQPGFSLLGDRVPTVPDPRLNLNNQSWSQPNVFDATTASLRVTQPFTVAGREWRVVAHGMVQRLKTDDRLAFPFGCYDAAADVYYVDRYCPDGTYDLYDFRSDGERRRATALDVALHGSAATGPLSHGFTLGALRSTYRLRLNDSAFNYAGTGNVDGGLQVPAAPDLVVPQTNRDERSTELYARDRIGLDGLGWRGAALWLGVRHSRITRESVLTDGTGATAYTQRFTSPFAAASWEFAPGRIAYASWGRGVETDVTPNLPTYAEPGRALPAAKSRQVEIGLKGATERTEWTVAAFDIVRPLYADSCIDGGEGSVTCARALDGTQRHRGLEATGLLRLPATGTTLHAGGQWLHARVEGRADPAANGLKPVNVPAYTLRAGLDQAVATNWRASLDLQHEGRRMVLPDNSAEIGSWTRLDLGLRWQQRVAGATWTVRAGVDNLLDRRTWKESPYQFAHAYLFPLQGRTARVSLEAAL